MARGKYLTSDQHREIYEAYLLGESRTDIAEAYGITENSVSRIVREQRELSTKGEHVAHRECVVAGNKKNGRLTSTSDPHRYEGTCIINGKANSKTFTAENASAATELWRSWCDELRSKQVTQKSEPVKPVAEKPVTVQKPIEKVEVKPVDENTNKSVYVIWKKGDKPKMFGAYLSMDAALKEVDNLNDISSFLVNERVFEVEEIALKA